LEPLATHIQHTSKSSYFPGSNVAVDEMVVRFKGRSRDTMKFRNKPTSQGYKVYALAEKGYTYAFSWASKGVKRTVTSIVLDLVLQLPYKHSHVYYNIYMDNFFTSLALFSTLRQYGIGAVGTARSNISGLPKSFDEIAITEKFQLDVASTDDVLILRWNDNKPVFLCSTIHQPTNFFQSTRFVKNQRTKVKEEVQVDVPQAVHNYNQYMHGVDLANQLRCYYSVQRRARRNWVCLFYFLVELSLTNSLVIFNMAKDEKPIDARDFRCKIVESLIADILFKKQAENSNLQPQHLDTISLSNPKKSHDTTPIYQSTNGECQYCLLMNIKGRHRSHWICNGCQQYLCLNSRNNCFVLHTK